MRASLPQDWTDEFGARYTLSRVAPRLRFLRYAGGDFFRPHRDGGQAVRGADGAFEKSFVTCMLYLGDGAVRGLNADDFDFAGGGIGFLGTSDARMPTGDSREVATTHSCINSHNVTSLL